MIPFEQRGAIVEKLDAVKNKVEAAGLKIVATHEGEKINLQVTDDVNYVAAPFHYSAILSMTPEAIASVVINSFNSLFGKGNDKQ